MAQLRGPFQGVGNIVRFNWHLYMLALAFIGSLLFISAWLPTPLRPFSYLVSAGIALSTLVSLGVSYYVYDWSPLYRLNWLTDLALSPTSKLVNLHAGFDESSALLAAQLPGATLTVLDYYDPLKHTEVSIKRARKAYPPYPATQAVRTTALPLESGSIDAAFVIFAAHEIRDSTERQTFFTELRRLLKANGQLVVIEHLRDWPNFFAYNLGFLHFYAKPVWLQVFAQCHLSVEQEIKSTPFVSVFILQKDDLTA
jgi:SAM-dependent methyltransferase